MVSIKIKQICLGFHAMHTHCWTPAVPCMAALEQLKTGSGTCCGTLLVVGVLQTGTDTIFREVQHVWIHSTPAWAGSQLDHWGFRG